MTLLDDSPASLPVADDELRGFLDDLIGVAVREQLWVLYFDDDDVVIPVMTPLDDIPLGDPRRVLRPVARFIAATAARVGAATVALVWEEPEGDDSRPPSSIDADVCGTLLEECRVRVRGQFRSTGAGVAEVVRV
ncbi:hypothetical protein ACFJGV_02235 [Cnuibacter sp. UC19_7]|uniref:hypothetical protein n=1 Tax=Cnuibacter sp. UC19_7 TaxID=3350166 RepID=UPI00366C521E